MHRANGDRLVLERYLLATMDVPRFTCYGVYISQLIRLAKASSLVTDFNTRDKLLTEL